MAIDYSTAFLIDSLQFWTRYSSTFRIYALPPTIAMHFQAHADVSTAAQIPVPAPRAVLSYSPVVLHIPDRPTFPDLEVRVTFPAPAPSASSSTPPAKPLPVVLLSHGHGPNPHISSHEGYGPTADFLAGHGFAVLQPTHLSSRLLGVPAAAVPAGHEMHWQWRAREARALLDRLADVEAAVPGLGLDRDRVAVWGHSLGSWTAALLLGAENHDPGSGDVVSFADPRVKAGVLLAATGASDAASLAATGRAALPSYGLAFGTLRAPALVVAGDEDDSAHLTVRGPAWHEDPYRLSPGPKALLSVRGGRHCLGGVDGWDPAGVDDNHPNRLEFVHRMVWAWLWSALHPEEEVEGKGAWAGACGALAGLPDLGSVVSKQ